MNSQDSINLVALQNQYNEINSQRSQLQDEIALQDAQIAQLLDNKKASDLLSDAAKRSILFLQRRVTYDSTKLVDLQNAYMKLSREFQDYKMKHPEMYDPSANEETDAADTNNLKLNLKFELSA